MHHPGTATLEVNLAALQANYELLAARTKGVCGAVVKANAYGLGVEEVGKALWKKGCTQFFVATLAEGIELRTILPYAQIAVFNGLLKGEEQEYRQYKLTPVLNDPTQVEYFDTKLADAQAILHVDTGMTRLGLTESALKHVATKHMGSRFALIMSHLACANEPEHPKNAEQLGRFKSAIHLFPGVKTSLANSAGLFLPPEYHFDVARPGCALYGINPINAANPVQPVVTLSAPILQIRTTDRVESVGYGGTYEVKKGARLAIIALGYSDGYFRSLSNKGAAWLAGQEVPVAGRISMDMLALDISGLPEAKITGGTRAEFINAVHTVNDVAEECSTIGYEIFTRIGRRVKRIYKH